MLDQEILLDRIRDEYPEELIEIILNCQFDGKNYLDVEDLNSRLKTKKIIGYNESLSEGDWFELLYELAPDIYDNLSYGNLVA